MRDKNKNSVKKKARTSLWLLALLLSWFSTQYTQAQNIPILSWRTHFSYNHVVALTNSNDKVFAAGQNAIFYIDLEDNSLNLINKNTGLSDVGIGDIHFNANSNQLIIAYKNGNIDLWSTNEIVNIRTVKDAPNSIPKRLRDIQVFNGKVYFSGDLGIVVYDLESAEITESYQNLGPSGEELIIYETAFTTDSIYAASQSGILSASLANNVNRQDFNNWNRTLVGIPFEHIAALNNQLVASADADIFEYESNQWNFGQNAGDNITSLRWSSTNDLQILTTANLLLKTDQGTSSLYSSGNADGVLNAIAITGNTSWIATSNQGMLKFDSFATPPNAIRPRGPATDYSSKPSSHDGKIYWISDSDISAFSLNDQTWSHFSPNNGNSPIENLTAIDFGIVEESNIHSPLFASFDKGLFFGGGDMTPSVSINETFSNTNPMPNPNNSYNITALASQNEALWVTTSGLPNSLYRWEPQTDDWETFTLTGSRGRFIKDLLITTEGLKWMSIAPDNGGGIVVFDDTSGEQRYLNTNGGQGGLPGAEVTTMVQDQRQFVWIGTNQGIAFYTNPSRVLHNQPLTASVPIFENRLLLRNEFITQMAVDPANRKWFGTRTNGLWLFSDTGEELVYHFTTENSPLPSNHIVSLYIDPPTGEIFIGTDQGMVSFRSDATEGSSVHSNVIIYPNPVRPDFQRNIVINGLANNALLKITDVSGKLVKEIRANGSTALWNGRNVNSQKVNSGVYLVFSSSADGTETYVGKIVVI